MKYQDVFSSNYRRILVPYEFRPEFKFTLQAAEEIAKYGNGSVTLLHSIRPTNAISTPFPHGFTFPISDTFYLFEENKKALAKIADESSLPNSRFNVEIMRGSLNNNILSLQESNPHDLIIVPDFHHTFFGRLASSINVPGLMKKSNVPVLAINNGDHLLKIRNILLPIRDVNGWFDKVPYTVSMANLTDSKITLMALVDETSPNPLSQIRRKLRFCEKVLKTNGCYFEVISTSISKEPHLNIIDAATKCKADLIALTPSKNISRIQYLFGSDLYEKVISNCSIPVFGMIK
ncbi:MAG TPA: universal stress protein [Bacteroidia bacterium]|nr:universal stress protein [Bacteroidia bacterium]